MRTQCNMLFLKRNGVDENKFALWERFILSQRVFLTCSQIISFFELRYNVFARRGEGLFSFYYKGILVIFD